MRVRSASRALCAAVASLSLLPLLPACREAPPQIDVPAYPSKRGEELGPPTPLAGAPLPPPRNVAPPNLPPPKRDPEALKTVAAGAEALLVERSLADCSDVVYTYGSIRVVQPKAGECEKLFGEKHYTLIDDKVSVVGTGLKPRREPPPSGISGGG